MWGEILSMLLSKAKQNPGGGQAGQQPDFSSQGGDQPTQGTPGLTATQQPAQAEAPTDSGGGWGGRLLNMAINHAARSNTPALQPMAAQIAPGGQQRSGQGLDMFRRRMRTFRGY